MFLQHEVGRSKTICRRCLLEGSLSLLITASQSVFPATFSKRGLRRVSCPCLARVLPLSFLTQSLKLTKGIMNTGSVIFMTTIWLDVVTTRTQQELARAQCQRVQAPLLTARPPFVTCRSGYVKHHPFYFANAQYHLRSGRAVPLPSRLPRLVDDMTFVAHVQVVFRIKAHSTYIAYIILGDPSPELGTERASLGYQCMRPHHHISTNCDPQFLDRSAAEDQVPRQLAALCNSVRCIRVIRRALSSGCFRCCSPGSPSPCGLSPDGK